MEKEINKEQHNAEHNAQIITRPNNTLKGGFNLFDFGGDSFTKTIKRTKTSEASLIKNYEELDSATKKYNKSYDTHIQNLEKLDDYANFKGMENIFKKVIMKENFKNGKVDKSLPILFRNYLIETETTPSAFRKEHIMRQIDYVLDKYFAGREHMFIKNMHVDIGKHEIVLYVQTIENIKKSRTIPHNNYIISFSATKKVLKDILATTKKNLKRKSKLIIFGNNDSNVSTTSSVSTKKKHKSFNSSGYDNKSKTKTKTKSGTGKKKTKKRTGSRGNMSIFQKFNNTEKDNDSNKSRESSEGENKLPSAIKIGTEKTSESTKKSVLDIYLTPSQKKAKAAIQGIPAAAAFAAPLPQAAPQFATALTPLTGLDQAKVDILQQGPGGFQQQQTIQSVDPEDARCAAIPTPASRDQCKYAGCYEQGGKCVKKPPRPVFGAPHPAFGAPPPAFGAPPAQAPPVAAPPAFAPGAFTPAPPIAL